MTKNEKIFISVLLIILVIVIGIKLNKNDEKVDRTEKIEEEEFVTVLEDGTKLNTSDVLKEDKMVDGLAFTNIQLTNQNGQSVLLADVENTNTTATDVMLVDIIILDKNGGEVGTVSGIISPLDPGETTQFNTSMMIDYSNAYDFQVVKK